MRNNNFFLKLIGIIFLGLFFTIKPVYAQEDDEELKKQVETLNLKVKDLEKQLENKQDPFAWRLSPASFYRAWCGVLEEISTEPLGH